MKESVDLSLGVLVFGSTFRRVEGPAWGPRDLGVPRGEGTASRESWE